MKSSRTIKAAILASGSIVSSLTLLGTFMVLARVLDVPDYATYRQTLLAYTFAAPLLVLALPQALYVFLPTARKRGGNTVIAENLLLLGVLGGVFTLFLLCGGNRLLAGWFSNPALEQTLLILSPYPLLVLPTLALPACLTARHKPGWVAAFLVLGRILSFVAVVLAAVVWKSATAALGATVVTAALCLFPAVWMMFAAGDGGPVRPSWRGMWRQVAYAAPLGLAGMLGALSLALDKFLVAAMCSTAAFAVYVTGAIEIPFIYAVSRSVTSVTMVDFARYQQRNQPDKTLALWRWSTLKVASLLMPVFVVLFFAAGEIMTLMFSARYAASAAIFQAYVLLIPMRLTSFEAIFAASRKNHISAGIQVMSLTANALLTWGMIRWIGPVGAALATVAMLYGVGLPLYLYFMGRVLKVSPWKVYPFAGMAKVLALSLLPAVVLVVPVSIPHAPTWLTLAVKVSIYAAGAYALLWKLRGRQPAAPPAPAPADTDIAFQPDPAIGKGPAVPTGPDCPLLAKTAIAANDESAPADPPAALVGADKELLPCDA